MQTSDEIDPSKVKAGDTVTLESGTALVRDVVIEVKKRGEGQFLFYTGETPDPLIPGTYYLVNPGAWTLTDHQPAPEPEPQWKVGTTGTAILKNVPYPGGQSNRLRVMRTRPHRGSFCWVDEFGASLLDENVTGFVPDEPRPLPTREQVKAALEPGWGRDSLHAMVEAVLALQRGESR